MNTTAWGLDAKALDDWLEKDLQQSGILLPNAQAADTWSDSDMKPIKQEDSTTQSSASSLLEAPVEKSQSEPALGGTTSENQMRECSNQATLHPQVVLPLILKAFTLLGSSLPGPIATKPNPLSLKRSSSNRKQASDDIAIKRQKNTDAARRSRLRKMLKMESLEQRVHELETVNSRLRLRVAVLQSERDAVDERERANRERVRALEAQLAVAHRALVKEFQNEK
ncbi:uncharacterized protein BYT42DRAFT_549534 [Radiomyces spectabilis]|uniref:uncharacterized protein n=1 Tax=Radiomyces spectabilis TaxID=64574 RepID=UPI00221F38D2|nr:uncharacterized protein BYT42DRAFT_549534 [Radiomyces spectabilis]KAI8367490.1 hypothetical protein BYT42DRAFT_549534 [Radiomyces spectabilis]